MHRPVLWAIALGLVAALAPRAAAEGRTGEQIYRKQCASCHGANGEGTDEFYPHPLVGDKTVERLEIGRAHV